MKKRKAKNHSSARISYLMLTVSLCLMMHVTLQGKDQPDWQRDIDPILNDHCVKCHGPLKTKADLDLSTFHGLIKGSENGPVVLAGNANSSSLYQVLLKGSDPHMPPKKQLSEEAIENIRLWIESFRELPGNDIENWNENSPPTINSEVEKISPPTNLKSHQVVDFFIEHRLKEQSITPTPVCDDRTFQRRLYIDLVGHPPTLEQSEAFLRSPKIDKRAKEVERLLKTKAFAVHFAELFDTMLMERRGTSWEDKRRKNGWHDYLESVFAKNRRWDEVVRELIIARNEDNSDPRAIWFLYERENNHQAMAEAVAPVVFGTQVKCAQCHDHPLAHEIKQGHYWGMVAAFNRSKNVNTSSGIGISESAIGGFISFANLQKESQPATLNFLNGVKITEKRPSPDVKEQDLPEYYLVAPPVDKEKPKAPATPKFSRRAQLADAVTNENPLLAKATVNRIWALLMGRGIVHPVDEMNSTYPASHPALLDWLATDFESNGFDIRHVIRTLANSETYQRSAWSTPDRPAEKDTFAWAYEKPLTAEVIFRSLLVACGYNPINPKGLKVDLNQLRQSFIKHFPDVLPVEYNSSLQQAMFLSNSPLIHALLSPIEKNTTQTLLSTTNTEQQVKQAFLRIFGRWPEEQELSTCKTFLDNRSDRPEEAVQQLLWALLTSAEFLTNH